MTMTDSISSHLEEMRAAGRSRRPSTRDIQDEAAVQYQNSLIREDERARLEEGRARFWKRIVVPHSYSQDNV